MSDEDPYDYDYDYQPYESNGGFQEIDIRDDDKKTSTPKEELLRLKEEELAARERELAARERILGGGEDQIDVTIAESGGVNADVEYVKSKKNWPICYPILDHSYSDIPTRLRKFMAYFGYGLFFLFAFTLLLNFITSIFIMFAPAEKSGIEMPDKFLFLIVSGLLPIVMVPLNFVLVYWTIYKAMKIASLPRFILSFIGNVLHIIFCIFASVGWYRYGFGGLVTLIMYFPTDTGNYVGFVPNLILMLLWYFQIICFLGIFIISIIIFRNRRLKFKDMGALAKDTVTAIPGALSSLRRGNANEQEEQQQQVDVDDIDAFYSEDDDDYQ
mmetsp:Transcript_7709/g.11447  ORF Transcript_7709/g.11447 Transcript_7709/m.11447 type:complete len:328 (+) Transcript_7709:74-1057(+)